MQSDPEQRYAEAQERYQEYVDSGYEDDPDVVLMGETHGVPGMQEEISEELEAVDPDAIYFEGYDDRMPDEVAAILAYERRLETLGSFEDHLTEKYGERAGEVFEQVYEVVQVGENDDLYEEANTSDLEDVASVFGSMADVVDDERIGAELDFASQFYEKELRFREDSFGQWVRSRMDGVRSQIKEMHYEDDVAVAGIDIDKKPLFERVAEEDRLLDRYKKLEEEVDETWTRRNISMGERLAQANREHEGTVVGIVGSSHLTSDAMHRRMEQEGADYAVFAPDHDQSLVELAKTGVAYFSDTLSRSGLERHMEAHDLDERAIELEQEHV